MTLGEWAPTEFSVNAKGCFEDNDLVVNMHGFYGPGVSISHWGNLRKNYSISREHYRSSIEEREKSLLWGFKDLRFYHFVDDFLAVTSSNVRIVNVNRQREANIASIAKYPGIDRQKKSAKEIYEDWCWLREKALSSLNGIPRLNVQYENIIRNPAQEVQRIADFVGTPVTQKAIDCVDATLNHNSEV